MMVKAITPYTIRQKYVTDCSFIASLCICAAFERRFDRKLVTSLIHPQTPDGTPMCSPSGKYAVKLWLNGVARQVIVDDYLPVDRFGNVLCSHTTTKGLELWVSIIEKAYMKLCKFKDLSNMVCCPISNLDATVRPLLIPGGGYDFPGSNSGVDLFSLTGWIPERISFPKNPLKNRDFETPPERAWERLCSASSYGDCLVTMSSSTDLGEGMADEVGLVTGHAYAVLSVIQTRNGTRLIQMKNPWAYKVSLLSIESTSARQRFLACH
jgi:calpain-7